MSPSTMAHSRSFGGKCSRCGTSRCGYGGSAVSSKNRLRTAQEAAITESKRRKAAREVAVLKWLHRGADGHGRTLF